ncbi:MAG: hypothetical protein N838_17545 [Thiohalocapsa sp. PB-PSB1]|jgi:hypothetical protein|nr:MAG: hypothetical protein N838_17545 [Thiohalocapsa sp. PB-PSB1]
MKRQYNCSIRRMGILLAIATALIAFSGQTLAGQAMEVCRDADGKAYFTDRGCPKDTTSQGRDYIEPAQTYNGRQSIDTRVLNNYEQRGSSGRRWSWRSSRCPNR